MIHLYNTQKHIYSIYKMDPNFWNVIEPDRWSLHNIFFFQESLTDKQRFAALQWSDEVTQLLTASVILTFARCRFHRFTDWCSCRVFRNTRVRRAGVHQGTCSAVGDTTPPHDNKLHNTTVNVFHAAVVEEGNISAGSALVFSRVIKGSIKEVRPRTWTFLEGTLDGWCFLMSSYR